MTWLPLIAAAWVLSGIAVSWIAWPLSWREVLAFIALGPLTLIAILFTRPEQKRHS